MKKIGLVLCAISLCASTIQADRAGHTVSDEMRARPGDSIEFVDRDLMSLFDDVCYSPEEYLYDQWLFLERGFKERDILGTVFQCSRWIGRAMAQHIPARSQHSAPINVLEAGAGAGSITREIVRKFSDRVCLEDHLDAVEIQDFLVDRLHEKFDWLPQVTIHHQNISAFKEEDDESAPVPKTAQGQQQRSAPPSWRVRSE